MRFKEVWKSVNNYEGKYEVSNKGRIRRTCDNLILSAKISKTGYYRVNLYKECRCSKYIHRLVAIAFLANPNKYNEIDHLDGNKANNRIDNLEWVSHKENIHRALKKGLLEKNSLGQFARKETQ